MKINFVDTKWRREFCKNLAEENTSHFGIKQPSDSIAEHQPSKKDKL